MEGCDVCDRAPLVVEGVELNVRDTMALACEIEHMRATVGGRRRRGARRGGQRGGDFRDEVAKICRLKEIYDEALADVTEGEKPMFTRATAKLVEEYNDQIAHISRAKMELDSLKQNVVAADRMQLTEQGMMSVLREVGQIMDGAAGNVVSLHGDGPGGPVRTARSSTAGSGHPYRGGALSPGDEIRAALQDVQRAAGAGSDAATGAAAAEDAAQKLEAAAKRIRAAAASTGGVLGAEGTCNAFQKAFMLAAMFGSVASLKLLGMKLGSAKIAGLIGAAGELVSSTFDGVISGLTAAIQSRNTLIVTAMSKQYQAISTAFTTDTLLGKLAGKGPLIEGAITAAAKNICSKMPDSAATVKAWAAERMATAVSMVGRRPAPSAAAAAPGEMDVAAAAADAQPLAEGQHQIPVQGDGGPDGGGRRRRGRKSRKGGERSRSKRSRSKRSRSNKSRKGGKRSRSNKSRKGGKRSRSNKSRKGGKRSRSKRSRSKRSRSKRSRSKRSRTRRTRQSKK